MQAFMRALLTGLMAVAVLIAATSAQASPATDKAEEKWFGKDCARYDANLTPEHNAREKGGKWCTCSYWVKNGGTNSCAKACRGAVLGLTITKAEAAKRCAVLAEADKAAIPVAPAVDGSLTIINNCTKGLPVPDSVRSTFTYAGLKSTQTFGCDEGYTLEGNTRAPNCKGELEHTDITRISCAYVSNTANTVTFAMVGNIPTRCTTYSRCMHVGFCCNTDSTPGQDPLSNDPEEAFCAKQKRECEQSQPGEFGKGEGKRDGVPDNYGYWTLDRYCKDSYGGSDSKAPGVRYRGGRLEGAACTRGGDRWCHVQCSEACRRKIASRSAASSGSSPRPSSGSSAAEQVCIESLGREKCARILSDPELDCESYAAKGYFDVSLCDKFD